MLITYGQDSQLTMAPFGPGVLLYIKSGDLKIMLRESCTKIVFIRQTE